MIASALAIESLSAGCSVKIARYEKTMLGLLLLLLACFGLMAYAQQTVPALTGHVVDTTGVLTKAQRDAFESKLTAFEQTKGSQVVVLLVPSTQPEDIASYANRVANSWKIGRKGIGDGLLLVVALQDHKLRIEVAKTLEGAIPDLAAKRVIDEAITPRFKQGDVAGGLEAGTQHIMALITGEALPAPTPATSALAHDEGFDWMQLGVFLFIAVPVVGALTQRMLGNPLGSVVTGGVAGGIAMALTASMVIAGIAGLLAMLFTLIQSARAQGFHGGSSSGGWDHGGGGGGGFGSGSSGSGGGFGSGGGGDFGGGGASGGW